MGRATRNGIMGHKAQRFGIRISRGWAVLFLLMGALLVAASWIGPLRAIPARLELLAIDGAVAVQQTEAQAFRTAEGSVAFAVPLAVRNIGAQTARPDRVVLSVPAPFRLATGRGRLHGIVTPGVPLRRYTVELPGEPLEPSEQTHVLSGLDTLYIEPDLPRYYCDTQGLGVPEFSPAPSYDPETLSDVRIFYSFPDGDERHTGVLSVRLDPARLAVSPAPVPPVFRTVFEEPEARAPQVGPLSFAGARTAHCGDPEQPIELYTVLWETRTGGRVLVLYVHNAGRKRLYDLNRDGIVELETYDADGDGRFEARRDARYAIPAFLMPLPPRDPSTIEPDPVPPDSAWLALFRSHERGVSRFAKSQLVVHPQLAVVDTTASDSARAATGGQVAAPAPVFADLGPVPPATPQFLRLFGDTAAGPFRFAQRTPPPAPPVVADAPRPSTVDTPAAATAPDTDVAEPAEDQTPAPRPRRPPLGTPIVPPL